MGAVMKYDYKSNSTLSGDQIRKNFEKYSGTKKKRFDPLGIHKKRLAGGIWAAMRRGLRNEKFLT